MQSPIVIMIVIVGILVIAIWAVFMQFLGVWVRAFMAGANVDLWVLVGMKLRRVPPGLIIDAHIKASKAALGTTTDQLESHYLAGGNVLKVVDAMIKARNRDIPVPFEVVAKTDLAGFDLDDVDPEEFRKAIGESEGG